MTQDPRKAMVLMALLLVAYLAFNNLMSRPDGSAALATQVAQDPLFGPDILLIPAVATPAQCISRVPIPGVAFLLVQPPGSDAAQPESGSPAAAPAALTPEGLERHYPGLSVDDAYRRAMQRLENAADGLTSRPLAFAPAGFALTHPDHDTAAFALLIEHFTGWTGPGGALLAMPQPELLVVVPLEDTSLAPGLLPALYEYTVANMTPGRHGFRNPEGGLKEQPVWYHHGEFRDFVIGPDSSGATGAITITPPASLTAE